MILSTIAIENYKQFLGSHEIAIPNAATVGVIGVNGVGKTTLFEAIEWCLYNPVSIPNRDVRPRGQAALTRVSITLERRDGSGQIIIDRELKRSTTTAAIYDVAADGTTDVIVQGTRQVTDYVTTRLVGLSHSAFVATFFTRQKELHFFGNLGDAARRREVGRLLGLETIRVAQQSIGDDRKRVLADAEAIQRQFDEQSANRNYAEELVALEAAVTTAAESVIRAADRLATQRELVEQRERQVAEIRAVRDRDIALGSELTVVAGELRACSARQSQLRTDVKRLDTHAKERDALVPLATGRDGLQGEIDAQEAVRAAFIARREWAYQARELENRHRDLLASVRSTVGGIRNTNIPGWSWRERDDQDPTAGIARLTETVHRLDVGGARERTRQLENISKLAEGATSLGATLERYRALRQTLDAELAELMTRGDPDVDIRGIETDRERAQQRLAQFAAQQTTLEGQRDQSRALVTNLERSHFGDACPTCARPFQEGEANIVLAALRTRLNALGAQHASVVGEIRRIQQELAAAAKRREQLMARAQELVTLRGRINHSESVISDQARETAAAQQELAAALAVAKMPGPPSADDISQSQRTVATLEHIASSEDALTSLAKRLSKLVSEQHSVKGELAAVADVSFDDAAFRSLVGRHQEAARAATTIEQIDRELVRRPDLATDLERSRIEEAELQSASARLTEERSRLAFRTEDMESRTTAVQKAREEERNLIAGLHDAQTTQREAGHALAILRRDQDRVKDLANHANAMRKEYDQLDLMYREFTEFERYAANRLTPVLGDVTSELVRVITDGKYDHIEFDGNFGIRVFVGDDESFPLESFSGGERDAIALAARLALSRIIGSAATNQPGFLVLDEVFGSLDRDRRTRLLDLLGSISETFDDFQQVFIISHVDDVRTSTVFNELWRVDQTAEGHSRLRVLTAGEDIDDL